MPGMYRHIYLDFNASTPTAPEVVDAMRMVLEVPYGNPSSGHWEMEYDSAVRRYGFILIFATGRRSHASFR